MTGGWQDALFGDAEVAAILSADRQLADMLLVEAAFTKALGAAAVVSGDAVAAAMRAISDAQIDRDALAVASARDGVPVPDLVRQLRVSAPGPGAEAIHAGLTSQDVLDTALVLGLRDVLALFEERLGSAIAALDRLGTRLGALRVTGVTRMQPALKLAFADRIAGWQAPLADHLDRLAGLRHRLLRLQFGGAVGDRAALGDKAGAVARAMAAELELAAPDRAWHGDRATLAEATGWMALVTGSMGKIGQDTATMALIGEVRVAGAGGSSAMPHKANPIAAELLVTLARDTAAQQALMLGALVHGMERDGSAWMAEWLALPRIAQATGRALALAPALCDAVRAPG